MKKQLIDSQLSNYQTYLMWLRQCLTLAENVFEFPEMPKYIDIAFLNSCLLRKGAIAFFYEEELNTILALPFVNISNLDVYGRPRKIEVHGKNGYRRVLERDEFVIMYDNNGRYPLWLDILQYSERLALCSRTIDINLSQQKTPRVWKVKEETLQSFKDMMSNIDGFQEAIATYEEINLDDINCLLEPAPFVADKVQEQKEKIWNEFLRLIGISNLSVQKKERNIKDEIQAMQGGTIASRYARFEPRQRAIEEINKKFEKYLEKPIEVRYYDGLPNTIKELDEELEISNESEVDKDVS